MSLLLTMLGDYIKSLMTNTKILKTITVVL